VVIPAKTLPKCFRRHVTAATGRQLTFPILRLRESVRGNFTFPNGALRGHLTLKAVRTTRPWPPK
jgi:hypothetical protein